MYIADLIRNFIKGTDGFERGLIKKFVLDPQRYIDAVTEYYAGHPEFKHIYPDRCWDSPDDMVGVAHYGSGSSYEIIINSRGYNLCNYPEVYGLTNEQGQRLVRAILSCIPGSSDYKERVEAKIKGEIFSV